MVPALVTHHRRRTRVRHIKDNRNAVSEIRMLVEHRYLYPVASAAIAETPSIHMMNTLPGNSTLHNAALEQAATMRMMQLTMWWNRIMG
jgi:hypothetical protein